jgi:hypothetical protein
VGPDFRARGNTACEWSIAGDSPDSPPPVGGRSAGKIPKPYGSTGMTQLNRSELPVVRSAQPVHTGSTGLRRALQPDWSDLHLSGYNLYGGLSAEE